jgi:5'-nucleotidase
MELLGLDAAAIGNHEFDYGGIEGGHPLRGALEAGGVLAEYEWLAANIYEEGGAPWSPEGFGQWAILERGGVKVGVLGLSTEETPQVTLRANVVDLEFRDVVETARAVAPKLREAGAEVVVAVGHLTGSCKPASYDQASVECSPDGEVGRLLTELDPGTLDVMIMGHAHTLMHHRIGDTFVLEQRAKGHAIGHLELVVGPDGVDADASVIHPAWFLEHGTVDPGCSDAPFPTEPIDVGGRELAPDPRALELIEALEAEAGSLCDDVGCTTVALNRSREAQSPVGDLVATSMLAAFPDVDLAVTNSGGLRADLPEGRIRREHLQAVMPFDNRLLLVEMSGAQLEMLLRLGTSGGHGILQIAGGRLGFDPAADGGDDVDGNGEIEKWEHDRLCRNGLEVRGEPLDPEATYRVVTTDFLFNGGDHLGHAFEGVQVAAEGPLLRDAMNTWFEGLDRCYVPDETVRIAKGACP